MERRITKLRTMLLLYRYAYYVKSNPLVTDARYDQLEKELKGLVDSCPDSDLACRYADRRTVGSSLAGDYPEEIVAMAEGFLSDREGKGQVPTFEQD